MNGSNSLPSTPPNQRAAKQQNGHKNDEFLDDESATLTGRSAVLRVFAAFE
jgi:hypothetical protein